MPIKVITTRLGCSKNTVKAALKRDTPSKDERPPRGLMVDAVEPRIRELLAGTPTMPAPGAPLTWRAAGATAPIG